MRTQRDKCAGPDVTVWQDRVLIGTMGQFLRPVREGVMIPSLQELGLDAPSTADRLALAEAL